MKKMPSRHPGNDGTIVRHFRIEDYDAVIALWRRTEGVGLNESDTRPAIAAFLRRNRASAWLPKRMGGLPVPCCAVTTGGVVTCTIWPCQSATGVAALAGGLWMPVWQNSARPASPNATFSFSPATRRASSFGRTQAGACERSCG